MYVHMCVVFVCTVCACMCVHLSAVCVRCVHVCGVCERERWGSGCLVVAAVPLSWFVEACVFLGAGATMRLRLQEVT